MTADGSGTGGRGDGNGSRSEPAQAAPAPGRWVMAQRWHDVLFAHWPVPAAALARLLPPALALDTFEGSGWLGVVPFRMSGVRLRGLPALPGASAFPELNVRTYATPRGGGAPGVWFFSLDAASALAVAVARRWFHLPYFRSRMSCDADGDGLRYECLRRQRGAPAAEFRACYRPAGRAAPARPGSREHFFAERYCLYAVDARGRLQRGDVQHAPWPLQPAQAELQHNTMAAALGLALPATPPLLHFARRLDVRVLPLRPHA